MINWSNRGDEESFAHKLFFLFIKLVALNREEGQIIKS